MRRWWLVVGCSALPILGSACSTDSLGLKVGTTLASDSTSAATLATTPLPSTPVATAFPTIPPVTAAPPPWVPEGWSVDQVNTFLGQVSDALKGLGAEYALHPTAGTATLDSGTSIDLSVIAAQVAGTAPSTWASAIDTYVNAALSPGQGDSGGSWAQVKPLLRVRVGTLASFDTPATRLVSHAVVGDLTVAAVLDRNGIASLVTPDQVQTWGQTADSVLAAGITQTLARTLIPQIDGPYATMLKDRFASSWLLDPSAIIRPPQPGGYVVAIPSTDQFLALIVDSALTQEKLDALAARAGEDYDSSSSPASGDLYWWHDGIFTPLAQSGGHVQIPTDLSTAISRI